MEPEAFGRRCILKKGGGPDVPVAIRRRTAYEFTTLENGIPTGFVAKRTFTAASHEGWTRQRS
jgi:hypothetical protein